MVFKCVLVGIFLQGVCWGHQVQSDPDIILEIIVNVMAQSDYHICWVFFSIFFGDSMVKMNRIVLAKKREKENLIIIFLACLLIWVFVSFFIGNILQCAKVQPICSRMECYLQSWRIACSSREQDGCFKFYHVQLPFFWGWFFTFLVWGY